MERVGRSSTVFAPSVLPACVGRVMREIVEGRVDHFAENTILRRTHFQIQPLEPITVRRSLQDEPSKRDADKDGGNDKDDDVHERCSPADDGDEFVDDLGGVGLGW